MRKTTILVGGVISSIVLAGGTNVAGAQSEPPPTASAEYQVTGLPFVEDWYPGFVQDPMGGEMEIALEDVPAIVLHTAEAAFQGGEVSAAVLDLDGPLGVYEVQGERDGQALEADVRADGTLEELEVTIEQGEVPSVVLDRLEASMPDFEAAEVEVSLRPTGTGFLEVWFEFGGEDADVEVNSTGTAYLVEPA